MKHLIGTIALVFTAGLSAYDVSAADAPAAPATAPAAAKDPTQMSAPAGAYTLDKSHASLIARMNHLGFSHFTARFTRFDAQLQFDPAHLQASRVTATIDPNSIDCDNAPPGFLDALRGDKWLDAKQYPEISFRTRSVELLAPHKLRVHGDFKLHGRTHPMTMDAVFNGGYAGHPMDPHARIGFSAQGTFKRSDYGIAYGIPAPGSQMGVGDDVNVTLEMELSGPPLPK